MKIPRILILMIALTLTGMPVLAQQQMSGQRDTGEFSPGGQDGPPSAERREEVRKKIEAVRIWRLTEELKLDTDTSARLSSLLSSLEQKRHATMHEQMETMRDLRFLLKAAKPDEAKIKPLLEKLEKNHSAMQSVKDQELKGIKDILTIEQQARFLLFQQEFQREMRDMISGARGKGPGRRGGPMNDAPDRDLRLHPPR